MENLTSSSISLSPRSSLSSRDNWQKLSGKDLRRCSLSSRLVSAVSDPKSCGKWLSDISLRPRVVRYLSCTNPAGSCWMGLLLKSATCSALRPLILSGMSEISEKKRKEIINVGVSQGSMLGPLFFHNVLKGTNVPFSFQWIDHSTVMLFTGLERERERERGEWRRRGK